MITRRHPLLDCIALLALLAGQVSMQGMPCLRVMPAAGAGMPGPGHHDGSHHQAPSPDEQGHPCCACVSPCRADLLQGADLARAVRALAAPTVSVPGRADPELAPAFTPSRSLPPVRGPPAIA